MAELQNAIAYVQELMSQIPGIKAAPDYPPEQLDPFPFAVAFAGDGDWVFGAAGVKRGLHAIKLQIHVARKDLPHDIQAAMVFSDIIPNKLMADPTLGGKVSTFIGIHYDFGPIGWQGMETIGWRFLIQGVKMESAIT